MYHEQRARLGAGERVTHVVTVPGRAGGTSAHRVIGSTLQLGHSIMDHQLLIDAEQFGGLLDE